MRANNLILPGITFSILLLYIFTNFISSPRIVWASNADLASEASPVMENSNPGLSPQFPNSIQQWKEIIERNANKFNLDANLIGSVILQESGGNPLAYSSSGAAGLMQVMPKDGLAASFVCEDNPCFQSRPSMQELYDPQFNIEYGSKMLSGLFIRYGDWREALRAYGPIDVYYEYADIVLQIFNINH